MAQNTYMNMIPEPKNEGQVLTVVSGEWQSAEPGGGASGLVVHVDDTGKMDKTYTEIVSCIENGIRPIIITDGEVPGLYDTTGIIGTYGVVEETYLVGLLVWNDGAWATASFTSDSADGTLSAQ